VASLSRGPRRCGAHLFAVLLAACAIPLAAAPVAAQGSDAAPASRAMHVAAAPELRPGAWELGLGVAGVHVEHTTTSTLTLRAARFAPAARGRAALEGELAYLHQGPLDALEVGASLGWLAHPRPGGLYPFLALAGGVRQEWLGSFRLARYPVGVNAGVRVLAGPGALMRVEYRWRRVLNDPVADFSEQQWMSGISLLLGNRP